MKKKILSVILCLNLVGLYNACECPPERYFEYTGITLGALNPYVETNRDFKMYCEKQNIYYLSQNSFKINLGTAAYATTVCEKGYDGEKYRMTSVKITSDSDFSALYPAGSDLGSLIKTYGINSDGVRVQKLISEFHPSEIQLGYLTIESRPNLDNNHIFTIVVEKNNGEIFTAISEEVTWQ